MAVVKANSYGHGLAWVTPRTLADADAFAVASAEEEDCGCAPPVSRSRSTLLEGFSPPTGLPVLPIRNTLAGYP